MAENVKVASPRVLKGFRSAGLHCSASVLCIGGSHAKPCVGQLGRVPVRANDDGQRHRSGLHDWHRSDLRHRRFFIDDHLGGDLQ